MARPEPPLPILALRFIVPFAAAVAYWLFRLPHLTGEHAGDTATAIEWVLAIIGTLACIGVMVDAIRHLYVRFVNG